MRVASPAIALATNSSARAFNVATSTVLMLESYLIPAETQSPIGSRGNRVSIAPARVLAAETLNLERTLSDLVKQACGLTQAEIALMWQTAPPRMPVPPPAT